jgi:hypothetical protein
VTPLQQCSPVVQRQRHLVHTQETMVRLHPGLLDCPGTPTGRAAWLKPRRLPVRLRPWARPGRQFGRPPWLRTRDAVGSSPTRAIGNTLSSWSSLECSPACHAGDRGFKSRRGRYWTTTARYANRQSGQAQTLVICGFDSRLRHLKICVGWASASPTACKAASPQGYAGSTPARRTETLRPGASIGIGYQTLDLVRRVRFPHGLLGKMTMWWNWQTRDAQNVVPLRHWEFDSPRGH